MLWRKLQLNWRYGLGEFCIVVVGVLVALGVENWNSDRADRALELEYVESLIADLESDDASIQDAMEFAAMVAERSRIVLDALQRNEVTGSPEEFVRSVNLTGYLRLPIYSRTTINDLMATGNLRLLQSRDIRSSISSYYSTIEFLSQWNDAARDAQSELTRINASVLEVRYREYFDAQRNAGAPWAPSTYEVTKADAQSVLDALTQRHEARGLVAYMIREQGASYGRLARIRAELEKLSNALSDYRRMLTKSRS